MAKKKGRKTTSRGKNNVKKKNNTINNKTVNRKPKNNFKTNDKPVDLNRNHKTQINKTNNKKINQKTSINKAKNNQIQKDKIKSNIKPKSDSRIKDIEDKNINLIEEKVPRKTKRLYYIIILLVIVLTLFTIIAYYLCRELYTAPNPVVDNVFIDGNNKIVVTFKIDRTKIRNNIYCILKNEDSEPSISDTDWILSENNTCIFDLSKEAYYIFLKNDDNKVFKVDGYKLLGKVTSLKINNDKKVYLPIKGTFKIESSYDYIGVIEDKIKYYSDNNSVASVSETGIITGVKSGSTKIHASIGNKDEFIDVLVTNLITVRPKNGYDYKKKYLGCNKYSKSDNDLIDEILKSKIENVGYKTRAGVVEAARFLTLDFPYRINYFYENGRQTTNNVDGEGRYYHVGFYLHSSRYKNITGSKTGPKTWGCSLYSRPAHRNITNGLDCSGFVSWALLNGGFNVKDVGAGWSNNRDLTDYGDVKKLTVALSTSNKIKVGDLLHSERAGGHIGIIVGIDKYNYYVAQALWYGEKGVVITKINKAKLKNHFPHVVLMDKYYKNDGNLTNMW